ncbi:MAG: hypothetical protein HZC14_03840 [Candidatus Niyogibacteria bacterium]|nr:hypothetical protein [Candidatus Niyogibacteria bacterium]
MSLYFGHPINTYDTELEKQLLKAISEIFPGWSIENPNQKHHQAGYEYFLKLTGHEMEYFYKEVLPKCHAGIFLPFRDGKWGAGVFKEAAFMASRKRPIYQITADGVITEVILKDDQMLSVEETRSRIRTTDGKIRPY